MAKASKAFLVSAIVILAILSVFGSWWMSRPLPTVESPQFVFSDDFSLPDDSHLTESGRRGLNDLLRRFDELPMRSLSFPDKESYRLILMPTFDAPILIRASKKRDGFELVTKLLDGKGGYAIGNLNSSEKREMTAEEWEHLTKLLDDASFWSMPTFDRNEPIPNDGADWLVESRTQENFHHVDRLTPKGVFLDACLYFLQLAGRKEDYTGYF